MEDLTERDFLTYARKGAEVELNNILTAFPDLRATVQPAPVAQPEPTPKATPEPKSTRRHWTKAQRAAMSKRMRLYWSARRGVPQKS